jgi:uncharacterized protein with gpF-like domain
MNKTITKAVDPTDLESLLNDLEPKIKRAFLEVIQGLKDPETLQEIMDMLQSGRTQDAIALVEKHITVFSSKLLSFYTVAGTVAASALSSLVGVAISFNQTNWRAVQVMQQNRLRLITEFTEDQAAAIRQIMVAGIGAGINPVIQARDLKAIIGLTQRQILAVANYRRMLEQNSLDALSRALRDRRFDQTVATAVNSGTGLTKDQIDRMVDTYANRQLTFRAETIARTESLRAVHQANQEMLTQAIENGDIDSDEIIQEWITAGDERVRSSHAEMQGQKRPFGEPFISGNGNELDFPGDPDAPANEVINCRCVLTTRLTDKPKET